MKHKHRIKPGYEGGEYKEGNVVVLSPTQHAMWHFAEWQRKGNWEDKLAWQGLVGIIGKDEVAHVAMSEVGKKGGEINGKFMKTPEGRERSRKQMLGTRLSAETRAKMRESAAKAGRGPQAAFLKNIANSPHKKPAGRKGMLVRWGWEGLFPSEREYRTSLSETFVEYYAKYGRP